MYENNYLAKRLRTASIGQEDTCFLRFPESETIISYGDFFGNAEKIASLLSSLGVQPGDRVAVQASKTPAILELYVGVVLAGAVFLPLNTDLTPSEVSYFLADATPTVFVCDTDNLDTLFSVALESGVKHVFTLGKNETGSLIEMRNMQTAGFASIAREPNDLAALIYTSGTTGRSKGAMLTHRALASNSQTLAEIWQFTPEDVLLHVLPVFHTHGLFVATNITLMAGGSCIFFPSFDAGAVCKAMPSATAFMGVPTHYVRLLGLSDLAKSARNMRLFVSGSAPLLSETHSNWRAQTGHAILERYGMTETNMNTSNPYLGERRPGTVGFPLPGVEIRITDPDTGATMPKGETGLIEVRGANVFKGYWKMPEKTAEELHENGYFVTGDLGCFDADGYVQIVGRSKDLIISGGLNIYPKEVEQVIDQIDGVNESAVIGVPHDDFGEAVVAVVVLQTGATKTDQQILSELGESLARFKHPKAVIFVEQLLRNTMGKVQKNELRSQYVGIFTTDD